MIDLNSLVFVAGIAQLGIVIGSLAIPKVLRWSSDVAKLRPLTGQVFWTYAAYIWSTNLFFGLISVLMPDQLIAGGQLPAALTLFITIYWAARVGIQFFYFDRTDAPQGLFFVFAEWILVGLFIFLTGVYGCSFLLNAGIWGTAGAPA